MPYLQCPECRLTVPSAAYYLRGDECPRCLARMEKRATFRADAPATTPVSFLSRGADQAPSQATSA